MCTLAVYFRVFPEYPLVIAANRDELLSRPATAPGILDPDGEVFGGRDEVCGGTWFGVNRSGVAAALLNRRSAAPPDPSKRSRGLLCLEALRYRAADEARGWIAVERAATYNPFNLLVADASASWVATTFHDEIGVSDLRPGLHLLTNLDLNDPTCPRIAGSYRSFAALLDSGQPRPRDPEFTERLREILSSHDMALDPRSPELGNSLCLHLGDYGTCSSTLAFLHASGRWTYLHSDRAPCRGEYVEQQLRWDPWRA